MNGRDYIWHPFTQMKTAAPPLHVTHAKDCTLFTADGKQYIDAIASWWVNIHGHCNEKIAAAIAAQASTLEHVIFAGFVHDPAIQVAEKLMEMLPAHFAKLFFSDDGSTSVEVAIKMALQYWHNQGQRQRTQIIAFENAYHGDTFGAMSVAERNAFNAAFEPLLFEVKRLPLPTHENIESLKSQLQQWLAEGNTAAFIFEPLVQGASGMLMYAPEQLDALIHIAQSAGVLCIADEVMTGFGRTGKLFAIEYLASKPDIICLSKGITGGFLPLGVTVCTQKIYDAFLSDDKYKTFFHGHSYTANPIACAAASASLSLLQEPVSVERINFITEAHQKFVAAIASHSHIKEVRHLGTILAIEWQTSEHSSYFNNIQSALYNFFLARNVYLRPLGNVVYIMPPYCISADELETVYTAVREALETF